MKARATIILAVLAASGLAGCGEEESAPASAPPRISHALGPMPGPSDLDPPAENPYKEDQEAIEEGRELFLAYNCYGCHGGRGGGGMAPSLRDPDWIYGSGGEDIYDSIAEGRPHSMPAWGAMLPPDILWKLTAYIQSMGTEQEPDKPQDLPSGQTGQGQGQTASNNQ